MNTPYLSVFIGLTAWDLGALLLIVGLYSCRALSAGMPALQAGLRAAILGSLAMFAITGVLLLVGRSVEMSGMPLRQIPSVLLEVLRQTRFGHWWLARSAALFSLIGLESLRRMPRPRIAIWVLLALLVLARSATNHGGDQGVSWLLAIDTLHLYAAGLWTGTLFAATVALFPRMQNSEPVERALVFERLSRLSGYAVMVLLTTGVWIAHKEVGSWMALWSTSYGRVLDLKLALIALMLALGAHNRYVRRPALWAASGPFCDIQDSKAFQGAQRALRMEAGLGLGVLILVAILVHGMPPAAMQALAGSA